MKKYISITILAALAISLGANNATAGDDEALYALGGFIGGVITTKVLDRDRHHHHHKTTVHVNSCSSRQYSHSHKKYRGEKHCSKRSQSCGYYKTIRVREWVPGCWETYRDRCGNRVREWTPGYHTYVKKRVWVDSCNTGCGSRGRGGREYACR